MDRGLDRRNVSRYAGMWVVVLLVLGCESVGGPWDCRIISWAVKP